MKKSITDVLNEITEEKPTLSEIMVSAIKEIGDDDLYLSDNSFESVVEENETFYLRVVYLFIYRAKRYYTNSEIYEWTMSELFNEEFGIYEV